MGRNYKRKTEERWTKEDLLKALLCIKSRKLNIPDAARQYGISRATLERHYPRFMLDGAKLDSNQFRKRGAKPILTKMEEDVLVKTIRDLREQGFTVISSDIKRICFEYCCSNRIPNKFNQENRMASRDWYYGFSKRHPDLNILKPVEASASITSSDSFTSPDKLPKVKLTPPPKKIMKPDRTPPRSPVHVLTASPSKVTSGKKEKQTMKAVAAATSVSALKGRKQKQSAAAALKKPIKRLILTKPSVARGKKGKAILPHIPTVEEEEIDSDDLEEDDEDEEENEKEEQEEGDEEEEMDENDEKQNEAEKSDSDEEEVEEREAEGDDDEEGEAVEERNDVEEDVKTEKNAAEGEEEEEGKYHEKRDLDEEDDDEGEEDDEDGAVVKTEKDDSDSDGGCSDELLEKLLDMCSDVLVTPMMTSSFSPS